MHHNLVNALFLEDLLETLERHGWTAVDFDDAFSDPVFSAEPEIVPAGESVIRGLAQESGRFEAELRYPAEDGAYLQPEMEALGL